MFAEIWSGTTRFFADAWDALAVSFRTSNTGGSGAPPPPPADTGGGDGGGEGGDTDTGGGGGGGSDSGGGFGDSGINWNDTGWSGWDDWGTAYPYVETEDQTCFAQEKYKKPVCYAKGGKEQESELIVQGLKCSASPATPLPAAELGLVLALGLAWTRSRR